MGSIEAFPARRVATLADVWRAAQSPGNGVLRARAARVEDYAAVRALQRACAPDAPAWSLKQFESQLLACPEGQLVAVADGQVVGAASALLVQWEKFAAGTTWREITAEGYFTTHEPDGETLYAAEFAADSSRRGFGIARALFQAQRKLCRARNLRRILAAAPLAGYGALRDRLSPEEYARRVAWGDLADPVLRFRMSQGFQYCGILHGYRPEDTRSGGHAALLAWLNPLHAPPGPPALESERQRKCA